MMLHTIANAFMSMLTSAVLITLAWRSARLPSLDEHKCEALMKSGRWSQKYSPETGKNHWQPYGCQLHAFDETSTTQCLSDRHIYFIGDSTVRQIFWAIAYKLGREEAEAGRKSSPKHADLVYQHINVTLRYRWDPYLNKTETLRLFHPTEHEDERSRLRSITNMRGFTDDDDDAVIIISAGLWHARYRDQGFAAEFKETMNEIAGSSSRTRGKEMEIRTPTIVVPPPVLNYADLDEHRNRTLTIARLSKLLHILQSAEESPTIEIAWVTRAMTGNNTHGMMSNGLHVTPDLAGHQADVVLNKVCNQKIFSNTNKESSVCCVKQKSWHLPASILLSIVAASNVTCHFWIPVRRHSVSWARVQALLQFMTIVCYCWIADRTTLFEKSNKIIHEDIFKCTLVIAAILGILRIAVASQSSDPVDSLSSVNRRLFQSDIRVLARTQTEEWKGWMQVYILLYHYFGMSQVLWTYQIARVLVASYIFLTAYGHAAYFQKTRNFSSRRVLSVLLRLNMLPCILAAVMNNEYESYYFPELASVWFLVTFAVFWTKYDKDIPTRTLITRIAIAILILQLLMALENPLSKILSISHICYGPRINVKELFFRIKLDAYSPFLGMFASIIQHRYARWRNKIGYLCRILECLKPFLLTMISAVSLGLLWVYFLVARQFSDKFVYNMYHPLISILPIVAYVMARNAHQAIRGCSFPTFSSVGTFSLELFVLQYHIWLATDTKGLLQLGLLDRSDKFSTHSVAGSWTFWLEALITTSIFVWLSSKCAQATDTIVQWISGEGKGFSGSGSRWPLSDTNLEKMCGNFEKRARCQGRGVNIGIILLGILWLFNIFHSS